MILISEYFMKEPQTDRKISRKWEKERSSKQLHINQPIFGVGAINGGISGDVNGFVATESSISDLVRDFQPVMPIKRKKLPKKVGSIFPLLIFIEQRIS
jgi:hypothetical protein